MALELGTMVTPGFGSMELEEVVVRMTGLEQEGRIVASEQAECQILDSD